MATLSAAIVAPDRLEPASAHVQQILAAVELLDTTPDDDLLDRRFALAPDHRLDQELACRNGGWEVEEAVLRLEDGLAFEARVDAFSAALLARLDAGLTLRAALEEAVTELGGTRADVQRAGIGVVRGMLELGFLRAL